MSESTSRRVSSASTSSSLPRTPSSAHGDLNDYLWRDPDRLASLREAFSNSDYGSEDAHTIPATPVCAQGSTVLIRETLERSGWNVAYKSPVRSLSIASPIQERSGHRITRSASTFSSSVRLWPSLPPQAIGHERLLEELASLREGEDSDESKTDEENSDAACSQPPSESEDGTLRRRRHIRRPRREKPEQPRRLPPLPSSNPLVYSHSTSARYITVPFNATPDSTATSSGNVFSPSSEDAVTGTLSGLSRAAGDLRRRSHTFSDLPANRVRPLPLPTTNRNMRKVSNVPPLRIATLSLRSTASEADAVLTKTPNRRFNPLGNAFVPPPMPQDAGTRIDWDLIEDILEVDGETVDLETPIAQPRQRTAGHLS